MFGDALKTRPKGYPADHPRIELLRRKRAGEESEEFTRFLEQHPETAAAMEKWQKLSPHGSKDDITTDYVAVAE